MGRLDGKVAVITGASQGMGAATARLFVAEGAKVLLCDILEEEGRKTAADIGAGAQFQTLDVRDETQWAAAIQAAQKQFGGVDILINNAGVVHYSAIETMDVKDIERVLAINVIGVMLGAKHVAPVMTASGRGVIVNISSVDGMRGCNGLTAYTASKWAVRGLSKSLAYELGPRGIRVCTIHPGGVNTPMGNPYGSTNEELNASFTRVPLQRIGEPEEVARASLFIASDDASYISGAELAVDGGWTAGYYQPMLPGAPDFLGS